MTGDLNAIAKKVVELSGQLAEADRAIETAKSRREALGTQLREANTKLLSRVDQSVRQRVFVVDQKVVLVEFDNGVTVAEIDRG